MVEERRKKSKETRWVFLLLVTGMAPMGVAITLAVVAGVFAPVVVEHTQPPIAEDDQAATSENVPIVIRVLANDHGRRGRPLSIKRLSSPRHGTASIRKDGSISYQPKLGYAGIDRFTYSTSDGVRESGSARVIVRVKALNHPPVANAGPDRTIETSAEFEIVTLDGSGSRDVDGDQLGYSWMAPEIAFDNHRSPRPSARFPVGRTPVTLVVSDGNLESEPVVTHVIVRRSAPAVRINRFEVTEVGQCVFRILWSVSGDPEGNVEILRNGKSIRKFTVSPGVAEFQDTLSGEGQFRVVYELRAVSSTGHPVRSEPSRFECTRIM